MERSAAKMDNSSSRTNKILQFFRAYQSQSPSLVYSGIENQQGKSSVLFELRVISYQCTAFCYVLVSCIVLTAVVNPRILFTYQYLHTGSFTIPPLYCCAAAYMSCTTGVKGKKHQNFENWREMKLESWDRDINSIDCRKYENTKNVFVGHLF